MRTSASLRREVAELRLRLADSPRSSRCSSTGWPRPSPRSPSLTTHNERLAATLREARDQIMTLKEEVDRLAQPPTGFGMFLGRNEDDTTDVFTGGRKLRVNASPNVDLDELSRGQEVMLNEALNVVAALDFEEVGEVVMLKEVLADGDRALVIAQRRRGARRPDRRAAARTRRCAPATRCCSTRASNYIYERIPKTEVEELVLEEVPDIDYANIGGLGAARSTRSATRSSCRTCTRSCSPSTSSSRRRASCCTARPAAARR